MMFEGFWKNGKEAGNPRDDLDNGEGGYGELLYMISSLYA